MYIKINSEVNLSSGISIPAGAVVAVYEGYANIGAENGGFIPCQVTTAVFANERAYLDRKSPVLGVSDFSNYFNNLSLSVSDYSTKPTEQLLIDLVFGFLVSVYGEDKLEIVNTQRPSQVVESVINPAQDIVNTEN